jgi:hypothetical protein
MWAALSEFVTFTRENTAEQKNERKDIVQEAHASFHDQTFSGGKVVVCGWHVAGPDILHTWHGNLCRVKSLPTNDSIPLGQEHLIRMSCHHLKA